ncbi:hypothetical protein HJC23_006626 [Cyclotella cryptica]|uniref:Uncharacterized protein n=1 Tax=Cyclotella cryptica TaxID=29204 RepID=A0ABD3QXW9_9STRA|eukprot:CCRYP_001045-RA/>CCRYP_001045-RA protein AED:0.37 eAED:0.37 QI:0/-1/0/1/-1/1/1/0/170
MQYASFVSQTTLNRSKQVTFSETATLVIVYLDTQPALNVSWYTQHEISRFKQEAFLSANSLLETNTSVAKAYIEKSLFAEQSNGLGKFGGIEHICGIEHLLSSQVMQMILTTRSLTIERVLQEQERQRRTGEIKGEVIAQASVKTSAFAREWRRRVAALNSTDSYHGNVP